MTETLNHQSTAEIFLLDTLRPALSELDINIYELGDAYEIEVRDGQAVKVAAPMPYAVYDLRVRPDRRSKLSLAYAQFDGTVRAVIRGPKRDTEAPVAAINQALGSAVGEVDGVRVECQRVSPFSAPVYYLQGDNTPIRERGIRVDLRVWGG